jgi:hypothetical protein
MEALSRQADRTDQDQEQQGDGNQDASRLNYAITEAGRCFRLVTWQLPVDWHSKFLLSSRAKGSQTITGDLGLCIAFRASPPDRSHHPNWIFAVRLLKGCDLASIPLIGEIPPASRLRKITVGAIQLRQARTKVEALRVCTDQALQSLPCARRIPRSKVLLDARKNLLHAHADNLEDVASKIRHGPHGSCRAVYTPSSYWTARRSLASATSRLYSAVKGSTRVFSSEPESCHNAERSPRSRDGSWSSAPSSSRRCRHSKSTSAASVESARFTSVTDAG